VSIEPPTLPKTLIKVSNSNWGKMALINAAVAAWIVYDLSTATEAPRQAVMIMQYVFLTFSLIGLAGSLFKLTS
jgi:hypothetical protein